MKSLLLDIAPLRFSAKFRGLWIAGLVTGISVQALNAALAWQVFQATGSSLHVGLLGVAIGLPTVLVALFGGVLADTRSPKTVGLIGVAGQLAAIVLFLAAHFWWNSVPLPVVYAFLALNSAAGALAAPVRKQFLRVLLRPDLMPAAAALYLLAMHAGLILGPLLAGFLLANAVPLAVFCALHLMFLLVYLLAFLVLPRVAASERAAGSLLGAAAAGLKYVWREPVIRFSLLVDLMITAFALPIVLLPQFVAEVLHADAAVYGFLLASVSAGGVVATVFSGVFTRARSTGRVLVLAAIVWLLSIALFSQSSVLWLAVCALFIMGACDTVALAAQAAIVQVAAKESMLGRVGGLQMLVGMGGPQLGGARAGAFGVAFGPQLGALLGVPLAALAFVDVKGVKAVWQFQIPKPEVAASSV
ncbi:MAG: MFS transporter [Microbacteriaceae bacterium]|nr:MFS transporter [Microbacteriaceae bacterium]